MDSARAFWVVAPGAGEIRREELPARAPDAVRVRTLFSAISRGTEALVFHGRVPESEWQRMRAPHQAGTLPGPIKYGYANVGRVVEGDHALAGSVVFCLYPHQTEYVVPATSVLSVPASVPNERAVLAANLETAVNAVWDARPLLGDRISVVGAGVVGSLVAFLVSRQLAIEVELIDTNPDRQSVADAFGASFATPDNASKGRDLVFHTSGTEAGLDTCLGLCRDDARIIELSWYGDRRVKVDLGSSFHARRLKLCSSQVGTVSPNARARYNHRQRLSLALSLCADERLDVLFEPELVFNELPRAMPRILAPAGRFLCQRVRY